MIAVYAIVNLQNGKKYIGQTIDLGKRWNQHRWDLRRGNHDNSRLQEDWNRYGEDAFVIEVLEEVPREQLLEKEQEWVAKTNAFECGYNMTLGGAGTPGMIPWDYGIKRPESTRQKLSVSAKLRIGEKNSFYGKTHSDETKERLRAYRSIPVIDLDTGIVYPSAKAAELAFNGKGSSVTKVLKGKLQTAYGHRWAYANGI